MQGSLVITEPLRFLQFLTETSQRLSDHGFTVLLWQLSHPHAHFQSQQAALYSERNCSLSAQHNRFVLRKALLNEYSYIPVVVRNVINMHCSRLVLHVLVFMRIFYIDSKVLLSFKTDSSHRSKNMFMANITNIYCHWLVTLHVP